MYISNFRRLPPPYRVPQGEALRWLAEAHARHAPDIGPERFHKMLSRFGCGPEQISHRSSFLGDFAHRSWEDMRIFGHDACLDERQAFFKEALLEPVDAWMEDGEFRTWIHVTCTGYVSPSLIQSIVSRRGWGGRVECLHAYHMGCYASLPALRMARGNGATDILHTELCTLHLDPASHEPEQLVIQTLFADGVIAYRVDEKPAARGLKVLELREIVAPESLSHMTWDVSSRGFRMTLAREVPQLVKAGVRDLAGPWMEDNTVFAIHPGGPRIIDAVQEALGLSEEQVSFSRAVLREHGNMSSATLPHVWMRMLDDVPEGTPVVSLAFGPGLTLSGAWMRKTSS